MRTERTSIAYSAVGTRRDLISFHFGTPNGGRKAYVQAALHADETPAMLTAWQLKQRLAELEAEGRIAGEIVVVPVANPIGLTQHMLGQFIGRFESNSGQNFNRGFKLPHAARVAEAALPALNDDARHNTRVLRCALREAIEQMPVLTEFEALRMNLLAWAADADIVLDLHCSLEATLHLYTNATSWPQIEPLARYLGAYGALLADDSGGQSFDEVLPLFWRDLRLELARASGSATPVGPPAAIATIECRGQRDVSYEQAASDADAIVAYFMHAGLVTGAAPALPPLHHPATPLAGSEQLNAPCSGILVYRAAVGATVQVGEALFDIVDPLTDAVTTVHAGVAGVFYMRRMVRFAFAGTPIGRITGEKPFRTGVLLGA